VSRSWWTVSRSLRNTKVHYRVHKSLPVVNALNQIKQVRTFHQIFLRFILILYYHLRLVLTNSVFNLGFPTKIVHAFISHSRYTPLPYHPWLSRPCNISWGAQITKLLNVQFSPVSCQFISLRSKYWWVTLCTGTAVPNPKLLRIKSVPYATCRQAGCLAMLQWVTWSHCHDVIPQPALIIKK
jgi:hypothetical protein